MEAEQNALVYETTPLTSDLYINGPMQADIWISATKTQAAVAVRIDDVDASGTATPISTGLQSAVYRAVDERLFENCLVCSSSRRKKNLTGGIHQVFRGLNSFDNAEIGQNK